MFAKYTTVFKTLWLMTNNDNGNYFDCFFPGLSDPFVIVELLPSRVFHCEVRQTNVQKATLNPVFDECFEL